MCIAQIYDRCYDHIENRPKILYKIKHVLCYYLVSACLQVGVKGWAKLPSGEYTLGRVTKVDKCIDVELDTGKTIRYQRFLDHFLIPDIIPSSKELTVGSRVIAQWLDRDLLYPGIITAIHGSEYEVQFDDGDKGRDKAHQIRLIRDHIFRGRVFYMC